MGASWPSIAARSVASAALLLAATLNGCTAGVTETAGATRTIHDASCQEVFLAAQRLLRDEFGSIRVDAPAQRIESDPVEYRAAAGSDTPRGLVGVPSTLRRTARFATLPTSSGCMAQLSIRVERRDTARAEMLRPLVSENAFSGDLPVMTPIEQGAADTRQQTAVWTYLRRDTQMERQLLDALQNQFMPAEPVQTRPATTRAATTRRAPATRPVATQPVPVEP